MGWNKFSLAALLTSAICASPANAVVIFGMEVGKPISIPECIKSEEFAGLIYSFRQVEVCWAAQDHEGVTAKNELVSVNRDDSVFIIFPTGTRPVFVVHETLKALSIDGNIEEIHFDLDPKNFDAAYQIFLAKFGKPKSQNNMPVVNGIGIVFDNIQAQWKTDGVVISIEKRGRDVNTGYASIKSRIALEKDAATVKKRSAKEQKL